MNWQKALEMLADGQQLTRKAWALGTYIEACYGDTEYNVDDEEFSIELYAEGDVLQGAYTPSDADQESQDWTGYIA